MQLRGTVGILTGASRGIGARLAERLADKGVDLALAARTAEALEETATRARARGVKVLTIQTDVGDRGDLESLVKTTTEELGPIDLLVNNAGIEMVGYFERLDFDGIESAININLAAPILLSRFVAAQMIERGKGHICNIASSAGKAARPYGSVYAATKHGLVGFSWSLRAELAPRGVEVSVVCPGYVTGEGMFAEREARAGKIPTALKTVTMDQVTDGVLRAIERNKAEVIVGPPLMKTADVFHAVSPDFAMAVGRRTGLYDFLRREATGDR